MSTWLRLLIVLACLLSIIPEGRGADRPNIVFILADDLGYGDVRALNSKSRIQTPNFDSLAGQGMVFTDAHSSSAVCSPTRYALLTGRYNWRSRLKEGVLGGMSPPLIEPGRMTVASFLKQNGYKTGCIGKWHLGFGWQLRPGMKDFDYTVEKGEDGWRVDFTKPMTGGPLTAGFDYYYGIAASLDMVPYSFIENDRVTVIPTEDKVYPMMAGRTNQMTRKGPGAAGFLAENVLPSLTAKAVSFIRENAKAPFFLYLPLTSPHTPIAPSAAWKGKSGLNPYADFVMETDAAVGQVLAALEKAGVTQNTLVFFASDNGCAPLADIEELRAKGHDPVPGMRGTKADIFEGGHRIPLIVRWPGHTKKGSRSDQLVSLNDFLATVAAVLNRQLPDNAGEDSVSLLPILTGRARGPVREAVVHHSVNGSFAIRQAAWKLEFCPDSGGWAVPRPGSKEAQTLPKLQLYNLAQDPKETNNLQGDQPLIRARLVALMQRYVQSGRSTPGAPQTNTSPVVFQK